MRCPRCGEVGRELTPQGDNSPVYVCDTRGCRVIEFERGRVRSELPENPDSQECEP